MTSGVYNYRNLGKVYKYSLTHHFSVIDLIEDRCLKEYEISQDFHLKMIGKSSGGGSVFDMAVSNIQLPKDLHDALPASMINFLYDYQHVTDHVIFILKDTGEITGVDNIKELQHKWNSLKERLLLLPENDNVKSLLEQGKANFEESFGYIKTVAQSLIFDLIFPAFYNRLLEPEELISKKNVQSLILPELDLEIENYFNSNDHTVFIETVFFQDQMPAIRAAYAEIIADGNIQSLFFKGVTKYELDGSDHILSAESIYTETLNGSQEVISHILLNSN
nr:hypothetical protein [Mucilaginibacter sp. L294]